MNEKYLDMAPWWELRVSVWRQVAAELTAAGKPWPMGAVLTDLRWWQDQARLGLEVRPGRVDLARRWGAWGDWQVRQTMKDEPAWGDPHKAKPAGELERDLAREGSGWIRADLDAWEEIAEALTASGRPWRDDVIEADLRWWQERQRIGLNAKTARERARWEEVPGRVVMQKRWCCSAYRAAKWRSSIDSEAPVFLSPRSDAGQTDTGRASDADQTDTGRTPDVQEAANAEDREGSDHGPTTTLPPTDHAPTTVQPPASPRADLRREADRIAHSATPPTPSPGSGGHVHGGVRREHGRQQHPGHPKGVSRASLNALRRHIGEGINRLSGEEGRRNAVPTPPQPLRAAWSVSCSACDFTAEPGDPDWNDDWPAGQRIAAWNDTYGLPSCPACNAGGRRGGLLAVLPPEKPVAWAICHAAGGCGRTWHEGDPGWRDEWAVPASPGEPHFCPGCGEAGEFVPLDTFRAVVHASRSAVLDDRPSLAMICSKLRDRDRNLLRNLRKSVSDVWNDSRRRSLFLGVLDEVLDELEGTGRPRGDPAEIDVPD